MRFVQGCEPPRRHGMTGRARDVSVRRTVLGFPMPARASLALIVLALSAVSVAAQAPSDAAKEIVGAWEISNAARDKTCPVTFKLEPATGGFKHRPDESRGPPLPSPQAAGGRSQ